MTVFLVWWTAVVLAVCSAGDHVAEKKKTKKPNFILFLMDDVRVLFYSTVQKQSVYSYGVPYETTIRH